MIQEILSKTEVTLIWKTCYEESVEFCKSNSNIDLVLIDLEYPKLGGIDIAANLHQYDSKLPMIGLINRNTHLMFDRSEFLMFVFKPIVLMEFLLVIDTILAK